MGRGGVVIGGYPLALAFPVVGRECASILCSCMSAMAKARGVGWGSGDDKWWWCLWLGVIRSLGVYEVFAVVVGGVRGVSLHLLLVGSER